MTQTAVIPDYLKPAMERLETARSAHLANASRMDETTTAISQVQTQKNELEQENGNDSGAWRAAFRAGGAVITDELKQRHLARVARRELALECDSMNEVLSFELDRLKGACDRTARHTVRHITASSVSMQSMNLMQPYVKAAVPSSEQ